MLEKELEKNKENLGWSESLSRTWQSWKESSKPMVKKYFNKTNLIILSSALLVIILRPSFKKEWILPLISIVTMFFYFYQDEIKDFPLIEHLPLIGAVSSVVGAVSLAKR